MASNISLVAGDLGEQTSMDSSPLVSVDSCDDNKCEDNKSDGSASRKTDDHGKQTTSTDSSPLFSVDSCDDNKHDDNKSDGSARRKTTPVIREPSQSSEKSTPVSPMDNAFFPGPEKWWYQKECEQKGGSRKGSFLDLEPDNWWGCRRHSEADIIGIPPPSPDRRHSFSLESTSSKATAQDCKMKQKTDEKKNDLNGNKLDETDGCCKHDSSEADGDEICITSDRERPKHLNPPRSDVIDLSDVDEEQEPLSGKDDGRICSEHPREATHFSFDVPIDCQSMEFNDPHCEKTQENDQNKTMELSPKIVKELIPGDDEHQCVADQSCVADQIDCPQVELTDIGVDMSEENPNIHIDQEQQDVNIPDKSDDRNCFDAGIQSEQLQNEADFRELQSIHISEYSTEIHNSEVPVESNNNKNIENFDLEIPDSELPEESNNNENIEKLDLETPEQVQSYDNEDNSVALHTTNTEQIAENCQNKTMELSPQVLESVEDNSLDQKDESIVENVSPEYNDKPVSVETEMEIKQEIYQMDSSPKQSTSDFGDVIGDDQIFDDKLKESSSDQHSNQPNCPQITFSFDHLHNPEDEDIREIDKTSPSSSNIITSPVVKQCPISVEETPVLLSQNQPKSRHHQTSGLSQRCGKGKLEKDKALSKEEPIFSVLDDAKWNSFQIFISICVVLLLLGYLALSSLLSITISLFLEDHDDISHPSKPSREVILSQHLKHLEGDFPSQDPFIWKVIENAVLSNVKDSSRLERPLTILLAGLDNANFTTRCLATKLGVMFDAILQSSQRHIVENGNYYKEKSVDYTKNKIDEMLKSGFQSGSNCAIIHNMDLIPPCAISLFHTFYEDALFKDISFVYTIKLQKNLEDLEDANSKEDYKLLVQNYLQSIWETCSEMTTDMQNVLLSRIAGNVVVIQGESGDNLSKICS